MHEERNYLSSKRNQNLQIWTFLSLSIVQKVRTPVVDGVLQVWLGSHSIKRLPGAKHHLNRDRNGDGIASAEAMPV